MTSKIEKIDLFIDSINTIRRKGNPYEEERAQLSAKIRGFIRGVSDEKREGDYITYINKGWDEYRSDTGFFDIKCKKMVEFLETLKGEIEAREAFQGPQEVSFEKLENDVEKNKIESERRKNVAEFKYWGFAIELIDTVRQELKKFRTTQDELLSSINELRKELKESKELTNNNQSKNK